MRKGQQKAHSAQKVTPSEREIILRLVRQAVNAVSTGDAPPQPPSYPIFASIPSGVFVTLHHRAELRGCIGVVETDQQLGEALVQCAIAAATEDRRFSPIRPEEVGKLHYEVSLLSPLREIHSPDEIEVGRHGVLLEAGSRRGLLLPQVAESRDWDGESFLDQVCLKAGLVPGSWRQGTCIRVFTAQVLGEGAGSDSPD